MILSACAQSQPATTKNEPTPLPIDYGETTATLLAQTRNADGYALKITLTIGTPFDARGPRTDAAKAAFDQRCPYTYPLQPDTDDKSTSFPVRLEVEDVTVGDFAATANTSGLSVELVDDSAGFAWVNTAIGGQSSGGNGCASLITPLVGGPGVSEGLMKIYYTKTPNDPTGGASYAAIAFRDGWKRPNSFDCLATLAAASKSTFTGVSNKTDTCALFRGTD